jgi:molybdate transport system substrate-binding protein
MSRALTIISSMATRLLLAEQAGLYRLRRSAAIDLEAVGGVDAARRVEAGEAFDVVVLADAVMSRLAEAGHLVPGTVVPLARAGVAAAVREGAERPDITSESALRSTILAAKSVGYSTGPSGQHLLKVFERWGIMPQIAGRIVQAPPGVPVGKLIAEGQVDIGFQQLSELISLKGIHVLGLVPPPAQITTVFSGAVGTHSERPDAAAELLGFLAHPEHAELHRRHGMDPA